MGIGRAFLAARRQRWARAVGYSVITLACLAALAAPAGATIPTQHFTTAPGLHPPVLRASSDPDHSGFIFVTPNNGPQRGPEILDSSGHLVWFRPSNGTEAYNLEVQKYRGYPALTWYQGGAEYIMGRSYRIQHIIHTANGCVPDVHEFQITRQNTILLDCLDYVSANLTAEGGSSNGKVEDNIIQEVDPATGHLIWSWHSLSHIPISDTYNRAPSSGPFSYFHLNSIQQLANGNLMISARNTWALYEISRSTGNVIWELGGKHSNFSMGQGTRFEWQHDAHLYTNTLTLFDDAALPQEESQSSAKIMHVNLTPGHLSASLSHLYDHSPPLLAGRAGSTQMLPNGNVFIGWGSSSAFSEDTLAGKQIFTASFPLGVFTYRAYRFPWDAQPATGMPPHMASNAEANGDVKVFASWNGATQVAYWRVIGGTKKTSSTPFATGPRTGFQSEVTLHSEPRFLRVQALDSSHHVLGTSTVHVEHSHVSIFGPDAFVPARGGYSRLPVGCFTGHNCHISVKVDWGSHLIAQSAAQAVTSRTGKLIRFLLSSVGRRDIANTTGHQIRVLVTIHDSSGDTASKHMKLYSYSITGPGPKRSTHQSATVQVGDENAYVSSSGRAQLLTTCYGPAPCRVHGTLTAGGSTIGAATEQIGAEEVGDIYFQLTSAGRTMLRQATGNQLAAQVKLTNGHDTATGHIALISYG